MYLFSFTLSSIFFNFLNHSFHALSEFSHQISSYIDSNLNGV